MDDVDRLFSLVHEFIKKNRKTFDKILGDGHSISISINVYLKGRTKIGETTILLPKEANKP